MSVARIRSCRSAIAVERRALGLGSELPVGWLLLGLVVALNTTSTVLMLARL